MTPPRPTVLLVFFAALAAPLGAAPAPTARAPAAAGGPAAAAKPALPPLSPRQLQVRERIDELYRHRNETPPAPDPAMNPFRPPGAASTPPAASGGRRKTSPVAAPKEVTTDLALLQQSVAALKVSGTFEKDGQLHLVINRKPYKQGDIIQILSQGETVYLRVRKISRNNVIFALNETEMALKF